MNEPELKERMRDALSDPPPPMDVRTALIGARRAVQRRKAARGALATCGAVVLVLAGVVAVHPPRGGSVAPVSGGDGVFPPFPPFPTSVSFSPADLLVQSLVQGAHDFDDRLETHAGLSRAPGEPTPVKIERLEYTNRGHGEEISRFTDMDHSAGRFGMIAVVADDEAQWDPKPCEVLAKVAPEAPACTPEVGAEEVSGLALSAGGAVPNAVVHRREDGVFVCVVQLTGPPVEIGKLRLVAEGR
ncbi:hypothetical protein KCV87_27675 [Actinosynnema pretiosum subsp. pretiosum]|uniref:Uncharacterized protein n=1 Tax=Actinosynnema pretiosum subsp. pretiosum TaxID=103721 RepID=A0AA45R330_9PSEU|nr:hypothetical protein APASM_5607 [Actinosynnema pretiosum subsp. pretiosum]QUF03168.1 hypothetical protein KCV87_27675 [Actinosynnema pretiosum subsp. pretiosum]